MKTSMLSTSGRLHEKCKRIKPLSKMERQKVYGSRQSTYKSLQRSTQKKFSPFTTVSRSARDSYLLRVTCEPNTQTNYQPNFQPILSKQRRPTIDKASFQRIIGPVNRTDYSVELVQNRDHRCTIAFGESTTPKPLTARDLSRWRKTFQHFDFQKQIDPQRCNPHQYLKSVKSTHDSFQLRTLRETTQSNFNNFKRFSMSPKTRKAHDFNSDSGHKFMSHIYEREIEPEYDTLESNEELIRKSMRKPKGELRFNLFKNNITTRFDRADPDWLQTLDYQCKIRNSSKDRNNATLDFQLTTRRLQNGVHSKYPIRQSLNVRVPANKIN